MDLLKQSPAHLRPFSPVELDGTDLRGVEIRREWQRIDVLIACKEPRFVIAVENKVDSSEHGDQLRQYAAVVSRHFPGVSAMFVYLTREGEEASSDRWVSYSYSDIHRVLDRCRRTYAGSVGGDVSVFLDHYLRLIGSRFMDDPKIDDLCQRIYRGSTATIAKHWTSFTSASARQRHASWESLRLSFADKRSDGKSVTGRRRKFTSSQNHGWACCPQSGGGRTWTGASGSGSDSGAGRAVARSGVGDFRPKSPRCAKW